MMVSVPAQITECKQLGIARGTCWLTSQVVTVRVESGQATNSDLLILDIPPELVTATPQPAGETTVPTNTPSPTPTGTPTPTPTETPIPIPPATTGSVDFADWLATIIVIAIVSGISYWIISTRYGLRWGVRAALLPLIGGMVTYTYIAINMPGSEAMTNKLGTWGYYWSFCLGWYGVGAVLIWQLSLRRRNQQI
jgi:hypothetical protein